MRIALIGNDYIQQLPLISYGGIESCVENMAWGLYKNNHNFFVVVPKREQKKDYPFQIIETENYAGKVSKKSSFEFANSLIKVLKQQKFDVIWSQSYWSAKVLKELKKPVICTIHDSCYRQRNWMINSDYIRYRFISKFQFDHWIYKDWERFNSRFIYTGLVEDEFDLCCQKENYALWVGSFTWGKRAKGLNVFVKLAKRNKHMDFFVYGAGDQKVEKWILKKSKKIPNLDYKGELKKGEEHKNVFKKASYFIMPTQIHEAFGRVNIEALSKGTPVIASANGCLPELINNEVGVSSNNLRVCSEGLSKQFDYKKIFEYSKKFCVNTEITKMDSFTKEAF